MRLQAQHAATDLAEWEKEQRRQAEADIRDMQQEARLEAAMKKDKKVGLCTEGGREGTFGRDDRESSLAGRCVWKAEAGIRDMQQQARLEAAMKKDKKVSLKGGRERREEALGKAFEGQEV